MKAQRKQCQDAPIEALANQNLACIWMSIPLGGTITTNCTSHMVTLYHNWKKSIRRCIDRDLETLTLFTIATMSMSTQSLTGLSLKGRNGKEHGEDTCNYIVGWKIC